MGIFSAIMQGITTFASTSVVSDQFTFKITANSSIMQITSTVIMHDVVLYLKLVGFLI